MRARSGVLGAAAAVGRAQLASLKGAKEAPEGAADKSHPALARVRAAWRALRAREGLSYRSTSCGSGKRALDAWREAVAAVRVAAAAARSGGDTAGASEGGHAKKRQKVGDGKRTDAGEEDRRGGSEKSSDLPRLLAEVHAARAALTDAWAETATAVAGIVAAHGPLRQARMALSEARDHHAQILLARVERELEETAATAPERGQAGNGRGAAAAAVPRGTGRGAGGLGRRRRRRLGLFDDNGLAEFGGRQRG